jgi:hypothetical protein
MFFQRILKGISGIDDDFAMFTLREQGILCRWWQRVHTITPAETKERLTERNLYRHLSHYADPDPLFQNDPFCDHTPFISTTAGAVERDAMLQVNRVYPPFMTALQFATQDLTAVGYVYFGYVCTLGKKSIELSQFAEEVRELNIFTSFQRYQLEGEIAAKIIIPSVNLEKYEKYDGARALQDLSNGQRPTPIDVQMNDGFAPPEQFNNIRGTLD